MSVFGNVKDGFGLDDQSAFEAHYFPSNAQDQFFASGAVRPGAGLSMHMQQSGLFGAPSGLNRPAPGFAAGGGSILGGMGMSNLTASQRLSLGQQPLSATTLAQRERESEDFAASLAHSLAESDDFPALPSTGKHHTHAHVHHEQLGGYAAHVKAELGAVGERKSAATATVSESMLSAALLTHLTSCAASMGSAHTPMTKEMKYGFAGLLETLRAPEKDGYMLALGIDPTLFGLNLNAPDALYPSFASPFVESAQDESLLKAPACYTLPQPPALKLEQFSKFQLETLFYMFYQMPKDIIQALAAQELYKRDWRFHGELKIWLKPRTQQEMLQGHPTVQFLSFDPKAFETRLFNPPMPARANLLAGIVPEEEIRVKLPSASGAASLSDNA